jgi:membrane protein
MKKKVQTYIANAPIIRQWREWAKVTSLPGFQGVPLYNIYTFLKNEVLYNPNIMTRSNAIAFSFFMSLFPALLVLFSLIPYIISFLPIKMSDILFQIKFALTDIMPNDTGETLFKAISKFIKTKRSDFLSIGFVLAIYFSSNGLMALMRSFEKEHAVFRRRNIYEKRFRAIWMTLLLGILLVISTVLVILGNQIFGWLFKFLKISAITAVFLTLLKWLIVLGSIYIGIAVLYKFGMATRRQLHFFSPGASTATILSLLSSIVFSFYVDNFGNYDRVYGSFVAGIVLLLWLQLNALILIIGFELNAAIAVNRDLLTLPPDAPKTADNEESISDF